MEVEVKGMAEEEAQAMAEEGTEVEMAEVEEKGVVVAVVEGEVNADN